MSNNTSQDRLFDGALTLVQPERGHRIGTDAVLLAAACPPTTGAVCDVGSGVGAVGLRIAQRCALAQVHLVEIDPALHALARENVHANALDARVSAHCVDVLTRDYRSGATGPAPGSCDIAVTNPPFLDPSRARLSPDGNRRRAHAASVPLEAWLGACLSRLTGRGELLLIHRADALDRLLVAAKGRIGGLALRFVHPRADAPAHRVLLRGRRGSRAPLTVLAPLVLHEADGRFTPEAEAIHRGTAHIGW